MSKITMQKTFLDSYANMGAIKAWAKKLKNDKKLKKRAQTDSKYAIVQELVINLVYIIDRIEAMRGLYGQIADKPYEAKLKKKMLDYIDAWAEYTSRNGGILLALKNLTDVSGSAFGYTVPTESKDIKLSKSKFIALKTAFNNYCMLGEDADKTAEMKATVDSVTQQLEDAGVLKKS